MIKNNHVSSSFYFVFVITLIFTFLSTVDYTKFQFGDNFKPINLFSDIEKSDKHSLSTENKLLPDSLTQQADTCPEGIICLQNFTQSKYPLDAFFNKLQGTKKEISKVRIAWFGDSFTDADILVSDIRDTLQSVFGGNGVGFVPITAEAPGFRQTLVHAFGGWNTSSIIARNGANNFGINGHIYKPDSANFVKFAGSKRFKHTKRFNIFRLFYSSNHPVSTRIAFNDTIRQNIELPQSLTPEMYSFYQTNIRKVRMNIPNKSDVTFYGASLEDSTGIYIDNFSIKGNSGLGLLSIPDKNFMKFDSLLNYNLIVLQFGLNAVTSQTTNYNGYLKGMTRLISKIKRTFPTIPILLLSVSDRSERSNGEYITMKSIKGLVTAQEKLAYDNQLLFWNMYEAMGGENSMAAYVASNPPLANKDYTHLNFRGGRKVGLAFASSFIYEAKKFDERRKRIAAN